MRNSDSPYLADLLAISLRWLALFGFSISLGTGGVFVQDGNNALRIGLVALVITLPALWNGFVSALAIFNRRLPWHRQINVVLDILFAAALFVTTGGFFGDVPWVTLLPLFSSAIYYEIPGVLVAAAVMSLFEVVFTLLGQGSQQLVPLAIVAGLNLTGALMVGLLTRPLIGRLRRSYQTTVNKRRENERQTLHKERERMRTLFEMIETFSSTLNYQTVIETVLRTAIGAVEDQQVAPNDEMAGAVMLFDEQNQLQTSAAEHFLPRDLPVRLPAERGVLGEVISSGAAQTVLKPAEDAELSLLSTMEGQGVALCLPLIRGMNAYGVMVFAHAQADYFTPERIDTLQMLGNQAVIALQNARLYQDLGKEKERIVQTQDEEQKKLARSLHDGPTQSVASIAMRLSIARRMLDAMPVGAGFAAQGAKNELAGELVRVEELARHTTQEIRHMLFTLRPLVLETEGLEAALNTMADKLHDLYQQNVVVSVQEDIALRLDNHRQTVIFHLSEEAVNNARKHAQAAEIAIRLKCVPQYEDIALLEISDNGVGFDIGRVMNSYDRRGSLGMINLRERADQINGLLKIESAPGKGTRVYVFIPLTDEAADRLHHQK
jgi:signal transduction histidine kinase